MKNLILLVATLLSLSSCAGYQYSSPQEAYYQQQRMQQFSNAMYQLSNALKPAPSVNCTGVRMGDFISTQCW